MERIFICPQCGRELFEFDSFFACNKMHKFQRDANGNISLTEGKRSKINISLIKEISALKNRFDTASDAADFIGNRDKPENILIFGSMNYDIAKYLAFAFPESHIFLAADSKKELSALSSSENLLCLICDENSFCKEKFDLIISGENFRADISRLMRKGAIYLRISNSEETGREIFFLGFKKKFPSFRIFAHLTEQKRIKSEKRIFINKNELAAFFAIFGNECDINAQNEFKGSFITISQIYSLYIKE